MRDPNNLNQLDDYIAPNTILTINELPEFNIEDYDLFNEKEFKKYMKDLENDVRNSFEYRSMIAYLKENLEMGKCAFYKNVSNIDSRRIKIEIHHDPLSLYDICIIIYRKRSDMRESLDIEAVAKEVMIIHYSFMVGLIPLATTVHELVHNQYLFVPTDKVMGHYKKFVDIYSEWMFPEQVDILERIEEASKFSASSDYQTILGSNYIYLDLSGAYQLPNKQHLEASMRKRISDIRNNTEKKQEIFKKPVTIIY